MSLCLVGVSSRQSAPLLMEAMEAMEAMDAGMKKETQVKKKSTKGKSHWLKGDN